VSKYYRTTTATAVADGRLYASINDSSKHEDNDSFVELQVTIQRSTGLGRRLIEWVERWLYQ